MSTLSEKINEDINASSRVPEAEQREGVAFVQSLEKDIVE